MRPKDALDALRTHKCIKGRINSSKRRIWRPGGLEPPYIYLLTPIVLLTALLFDALFWKGVGPFSLECYQCFPG